MSPAAPPPRRTALFGGSFNPPHTGHIQLARQVLRAGLADEVWLMVTPRNPLKEQAGLLDEQVRLDLVRRALAGEEGIRASDYEFSLPRPSYTWRTLSHLENDYPDRTFSLLIGSDNWQIFPCWAHADEILARYPVIVYPRQGYPVGPAALPPRVSLLAAPLFPYSSTDVRRAARQGRDVSQMVPAAIADDVSRLYR